MDVKSEFLLFLMFIIAVVVGLAIKGTVEWEPM